MESHTTLAFVTACCLFAASCAASSAPSGETTALACEPDESHSFAPDLGSINEDYLCYGFSASAIRNRFIHGIVWSPPPAGGVIWHHATLYAVPGDFPDGPCDGMPPGAVGLHVWAPGGDNLLLPQGVGLELPPLTTRLVVELHVLRTSGEPAQGGSLGVCLNHETVEHPAMFFAAVAPVPAIRPKMNETSKGHCSFHADAHLWSVWPHMHLAGSAIQATLLRSSGETSVLSRVDPWDFHRQQTYPINVDVHANDAVEAQCWWSNPTSDYVLPGIKTTDEMCNQGFIGWPATALPCDNSL